MTDDARTTGSGDPKDIPPPSVAPADAAGERPRTESPAPAPPPATPQTAVVGAPPPPGGTATAVAHPPPPAPPAPVAPRSDRPGIGLLPIALGVGLLAAAIVISAARTRADGDLDWSNYTVGLGATAVLLLVALAALAAGTGRTREELVTWPGAIGILGVGTMIGVGLEDVGGADDWLPYLIGGVVVLLSVVAYVAIRRGAFVVTAILGLGLIYIQLCDDVLSDIGEDDAAIVAAIAITVFVLVITAVGWVLPTRAVSGVVAGVVGVVGLNVVLAILGVQRVVGMIFSGFGSESPGMGGFDGDKPDYDNDVYVILALAALLTLIWALAAALNGNPGFTLLAIAMPATAVPIATFVLAVEHPTWWGVGLAAAGAILLALAGVRQLLARKRT